MLPKLCSLRLHREASESSQHHLLFPCVTGWLHFAQFPGIGITCTHYSTQLDEIQNGAVENVAHSAHTSAAHMSLRPPSLHSGDNEHNTQWVLIHSTVFRWFDLTCINCYLKVLTWVNLKKKKSFHSCGSSLTLMCDVMQIQMQTHVTSVREQRLNWSGVDPLWYMLLLRYLPSVWTKLCENTEPYSEEAVLHVASGWFIFPNGSSTGVERAGSFRRGSASIRLVKVEDCCDDLRRSVFMLK